MKSAPTILEVFCASGLVTRGLLRAGAKKVVGCDILKRRRFPTDQTFIQGDVEDDCTRELLLDLAAASDFVWLSPPCQFGSALRHAPGAKRHKNLIPWARSFLKETGKPGVIENVEGAAHHLVDPVMLCGTMFGLGVACGHVLESPHGRWFNLERHRYFECHGFRPPVPECNHNAPVIGVYGSHARVRAASVGGRGTSWPFKTTQHNAALYAMDCAVWPELTLGDLSQGVPPAYAYYLLTHWQAQRSK